jgi:hypothetical protein
MKTNLPMQVSKEEEAVFAWSSNYSLRLIQNFSSLGVNMNFAGKLACY